MTEPEDFLSRWSRRKRDAKAEAETDAGKADTREQAGRSAAERPVRNRRVGTSRRSATTTPLQTDDAKPEDVFDLSKLPSLDSIGPATDIRDVHATGRAGGVIPCGTSTRLVG